MKTYVLYHASCQDGFASAFIANKFIPEAKFISVQYGQDLPYIENNSIVYILDFSYKKEILLELSKRIKKLIVLDHHKTAEIELSNQFTNWPNNCEIIFNLSECGATMTYQYFYDDCNGLVPDLYLYIKDRDLWLWKKKDSREFNSWLSSYKLDFKIWEELQNTPFLQTINEGQAILRYQNQQVERAISQATMIDIAGYKVPSLNATNFISEIGHSLCDKYKNSLFSATYFISKENKRIWSLRSIGDFDVSIIAKNFGGGGHKNAAGFQEDSR